MGATWLSAAFEEIRRRDHLNDDLCDILRAFGKDDGDAPGPANFDPDATDATSGTDAISHLQERIATELLDEIDADQASMFGRRFASVSKLLKDECNDEEITTKRLLRLALHRRTAQILSTTDPVLSQRRALRVRALVDFMWSQQLVLDLRDTAADNPTLAQLVQSQELHTSSSPSYDEFSPGYFHTTVEGTTSDFGPVHVNILRIKLNGTAQRGGNKSGESHATKGQSMHMKCVDARGTCTDLPTLAKQMGALAAISGGFFLYSEPDIALPSKRTDPVGLLVSDKNTVGPPVFQRATLFQKVGNDGDRVIGLDKVGMAGVKCTFSLQSTNGSCNRKTMELTIGKDGVRCIHRGDAEHINVEGHECCFSIVGRTVVTRTKASYTTKVHVPLAGFLLIFPQNMLPYDWTDAMTIGVAYKLPPPHDSIENAIAGGPMFLSHSDCQSMDLPSEDFRGTAPPVTFSQDETHDHNLLPRMGVGIARNTESGCDELVCVAVDGRNLDRALGLTLQGTSNLLRSLGCTNAMNLDGGSSKRMVIWDEKLKKHRVVCLSTTEIKASAGGSKNSSDHTAAEPSRPVHSAILFLPGDSAE